MRTIGLTKGLVALVDDQDYELVSRHKWYAHWDGWGHYYAVRKESLSRKTIYMHRVILGLSPGRQPGVDHVSGNGLDNRRQNLRVATASQNGANRRINKDNTSGYKGVRFHKRERKWESQIRVNKKWSYLGFFDTQSEVGIAYEQAAKKFFGDFARTSHE